MKMHTRVERFNGTKWIPHELYRLGSGGNLEVAPLYMGENSKLFNVLCGACDNKGRCIKISDPKGLPVDVSRESRIFFEGVFKDGGHCCSWNTVNEIVLFNTRNGSKYVDASTIENILEPFLKDLGHHLYRLSTAATNFEVRIIYCFTD